MYVRTYVLDWWRYDLAMDSQCVAAACRTHVLILITYVRAYVRTHTRVSGALFAASRTFQKHT